MAVIQRTTVALLTCVAGLMLASPASALRSCSSGLPPCFETPPPGVELELSAEENPHGLQPLADQPSPDRLLWPRVRGHKPYGFNAVSTGADGTTLEEEAMLHTEMGASVARVAADWGAIQYFPNPSEGTTWKYADLDAKYRAYVRRGVRPLLNVLKTPRRFTRHAETPSNSFVQGCNWSDACHASPTAEHLDRLATFVADLAKRYPLAAGIEVWNEPNLANPYWGGDPPDPEHYARMLDAAHGAAKATRPALPIVGGSLITTPKTYTDAQGYVHMSMREFLGRMLAAGASQHMDAFSYHPYFGSYPDHKATLADQDHVLFTRITNTDQAVRNAYADAKVPLTDRIVATELGASTSDGFTEERQAAWLRLRYWLWDVDHPYSTLPVDAAFIHRPVDTATPQHGLAYRKGFGLVRAKDANGRFATKQAYCAFRTEFGGFSDCPEFLRVEP